MTSRAQGAGSGEQAATAIGAGSEGLPDYVSFSSHLCYLASQASPLLRFPLTS
jgi:hypothetical protein